METIDKILATFLIVVLVATMWLAIFSYSWFDSRLDKLECQEDMTCWNCETMGNQICG